MYIDLSPEPTEGLEECFDIASQLSYTASSGQVGRTIRARFTFSDRTYVAWYGNATGWVGKTYLVQQVNPATMSTIGDPMVQLSTFLGSTYHGWGCLPIR